MNNKIYALENNQKLIVTDEYLSISRSKFVNFEDMKKKSEMVSLKKDFTIIKRKNIHEIKFNQKGEVINVYYASETNVNDKFTIKPKDSDEVIEIAGTIEDTLSLKKTEKNESKAKFLAFNIGYIVLTLLVSAMLINATLSGEEINARKGKILSRIADIIGPIGIGVVGLAIIVFLIYKTVKRFKNPAKEIVLKK